MEDTSSLEEFKGQLKEKLHNMFGKSWVALLAEKRGKSKSWIRQYFNNQSFDQDMHTAAKDIMAEEKKKRESTLNSGVE